jgi:HAD superfamily hydrolase (TIGR01458 family)
VAVSGVGLRRDVEGLLMDIDGVLTVSWRALDGAVAALDRIRAAGMPFRLLTNTTELSRRELAATLRGAGFDVGREDILTAAVATARYLRTRHPGAACLVIGGSSSLEDLDGVQVVRGAEPTDVVVVGGASDAIPWDLANHVLRVVLAGAPLVSMHGTLTWMTEEGMVLDSGRALVLALEAAAHVRAAVIGKPSARFFEEALEVLGVPGAKVAVVGDDLESDVLAAQRLGMTGVLVRTGKFSPVQLEGASGEPDRLIDSLADLPDLLGLD